MRTFVALDLPPDFADDVAALARQMGAAVEGRFLPRSTYHLTLAFLGDDDLARRRLYTTLSRATRGIAVLARGALTPLLEGAAS